MTYINESDRLAAVNGFLKVRVENARMWSEVEEQRGNTEKAFKHYRQYVELRDSVFSAGTFGDISQLQNSYEEYKITRQIEQLEQERRVM